MWDTPGSAARVLDGLASAHGELLVGLGRRVPEAEWAGLAGGGEGAFAKSKTLGDVLQAGRGSPELAVPAVLLLFSELMRVGEDPGAPPVLAAVDEYNALFSRTEYMEAVSDVELAGIPPHHLRLAAALRWLEHPAPVRGGVLCATSASVGARGVALPNPGRARELVSGYSEEETRAVLQRYADRGLLEDAPSWEMVRGAHAMAAGSGTDLRSLAGWL